MVKINHGNHDFIKNTIRWISWQISWVFNESCFTTNEKYTHPIS